MAKAAAVDKNVSTEAEVEVMTQEKGEEKESRASSWIVKVKNNPGFCGIGAGGVQFANGKATVDSGRMAQWFREHDGYEVEER